MDELTEPASGPSLRFPNEMDEAYRRGQEFRRLSPQERWRQISEMREFGMNMVHNSPRRLAIERRWEAEEEEWREIQRKVFLQYGGRGLSREPII